MILDELSEDCGLYACKQLRKLARISSVFLLYANGHPDNVYEKPLPGNHVDRIRRLFSLEERHYRHIVRRHHYSVGMSTEVRGWVGLAIPVNSWLRGRVRILPDLQHIVLENPFI